MMDNTISFIELIKAQRAIYDITHEHYKSPDKRSEAWNSIATEVGLSIDACKRKWKNLRDSYTKYLRSYRTGAKTSRKYQFWVHAEYMDFLRPFQGPGRSAKLNDMKYENYESFQTSGTNGVYNGYKEDDVMNEGEIEEFLEQRRKSHKPMKSESNENDVFMLSAGDKIKFEDVEMDSTSLFFLSLAKSVRTMPRKYQTAVKMLCMKVVSDAESEIENGSYGIETHLSVTSDILNSYANLNASSPYEEVQAQTQSKQTDGHAGQSNGNYEQFTYVMSPSRVEAMIDLSSDDEQRTTDNKTS